MKKDCHPEYREVVFLDMSSGVKFLCRTSVKTSKETTDFEGKTYPLHRATISSASHPFFTGQGGHVDAEKRIDRFQNRYAKKAEEASTIKERKEQALLEEASKKKGRVKKS